jgi:hypothetical protein
MRLFQKTRSAPPVDASAAARPVGRHESINTAWKLDTEILTFSRVRERMERLPEPHWKAHPCGWQREQLSSMPDIPHVGHCVYKCQREAKVLKNIAIKGCHNYAKRHECVDGIRALIRALPLVYAGYSVLSDEEIVDLPWGEQIKPLTAEISGRIRRPDALGSRTKFPNKSIEQSVSRPARDYLPNFRITSVVNYCELSIVR